MINKYSLASLPVQAIIKKIIKIQVCAQLKIKCYVYAEIDNFIGGVTVTIKEKISMKMSLFDFFR